jgi:hypothetical protein
LHDEQDAQDEGHSESRADHGAEQRHTTPPRAHANSSNSRIGSG